MATRNTLQEAEALKAQLEAILPGRELRIVDQSNARFAMFAVLEVRTCRTCGAEVLTAAIGEDDAGGSLCKECKAKRNTRNAAERERQARESNRDLHRYERHQINQDER